MWEVSPEQSTACGVAIHAPAGRLLDTTRNRPTVTLVILFYPKLRYQHDIKKKKNTFLFQHYRFLKKKIKIPRIKRDDEKRTGPQSHPESRHIEVGNRDASGSGSSTPGGVQHVATQSGLSRLSDRWQLKFKALVLTGLHGHLLFNKNLTESFSVCHLTQLFILSLQTMSNLNGSYIKISTVLHHRGVGVGGMEEYRLSLYVTRTAVTTIGILHPKQWLRGRQDWLSEMEKTQTRSGLEWPL